MNAISIGFVMLLLLLRNSCRSLQGEISHVYKGYVVLGYEVQSFTLSEDNSKSYWINEVSDNLHSQYDSLKIALPYGEVYVQLKGKMIYFLSAMVLLKIIMGIL